MDTAATILNPALAELAEFAGIQLKIAINRLSSEGFFLTALGTTVAAGWWNGTRYTTHVLQTDNPEFIETMSMNWLMSDHKKSKFVGIVMGGEIKVEGNSTEALILRARTADNSIRLMAYQPYTRATKDTAASLQHTIVDFPAEQTVDPNARDIVLGLLLKSTLSKPG